MDAARLAVAGDVSELQRLLELAQSSTPVERGASLFGQQSRSADAGTRMRNALSQPDRAAFVGTIDDVAVGVALARIQMSAIGKLAIIEELFVESEARGVGVGEALVDVTVDWCRNHDAVAVEMAALPGDRASKNLCERSGFSARLIVMHRNL